MSRWVDGKQWVGSVLSLVQEAAVQQLDAALSAIRHLADVELSTPQRQLRPIARVARPSGSGGTVAVQLAGFPLAERQVVAGRCYAE